MVHLDFVIVSVTKTHTQILKFCSLIKLYKVHGTFCFVLFWKGPSVGANEELDVEESIVVRCQIGGTIFVEACNVCDVCQIVESSQARFVVFMLQATPP